MTPRVSLRIVVLPDYFWMALCMWVPDWAKKKIYVYYCAQGANGNSWLTFVSSYTRGELSDHMSQMHAFISTKISLCTVSIFMAILFHLGLFFRGSEKKENKNHCPVFASSIKCAIKKFHVLVKLWWQNVPKCVMNMQLCCFASKIYCFSDLLIAITIVVT